MPSDRPLIVSKQRNENRWHLTLFGCLACIQCKDAAYCYRCCVVCVFVGHIYMSCAKTAEPIEMLFGVWTSVGPRNRVLRGGPGLREKGNFGGRHLPAHWKSIWNIRRELGDSSDAACRCQYCSNLSEQRGPRSEEQGSAYTKLQTDQHWWNIPERIQPTAWWFCRSPGPLQANSPTNTSLLLILQNRTT